MKKCVVDIRYHAAVGDYSRILVVLTSHQGERTDGRNKITVSGMQLISMAYGQRQVL